MNTPRIWREPDEIPEAAGWYIVERIDRKGREQLRAFGLGHWWIPLPDGWMTMDSVYRWHHLPVAAIGEPEASPLEEMKKVENLIRSRGEFD